MHTYRRAAQWLEQHTAELEFTRLAELLDADHHAVMAGGWLIMIGTEQAILPWQIKAQITVGLANQYRMVDAMHVRLTTIQRRQKSSRQDADIDASPAVVLGSRILRAAALSATIARLPGQRISLEVRSLPMGRGRFP